MTKTSEAYLDIVWKQFKKNRFALAALWALAPLAMIALFAPVIASDQPFVYHSADEVLFPWFLALFHPSETVDFAFNMAMLAFVPWAVLAVALNAWWRRRETPGRVRAMRVAGLAVLLVAAANGLFLIPGVAPANPHSHRPFVEEEYGNPDARGYYAIIPYGPLDQERGSAFQPPGYRKPAAERARVSEWFPHLLGTDDSGRDVFVRMLYSTRISLTIGFLAVAIYLSIGIVMGALAGYFGGITDMLISRVIEVILLFPSFFLILTLVAMIGPSIYMIMVVIGLTGWPGIARLIRGEVLKQRGNDYVAAARALGASHARVLFRHILPNALAPALVAAPFGVAGAIVTEAGLSLLGFGVRMPTPTWGVLLQLGNSNYYYWWLIVAPSIAIFFTVTVFNLIGSGLRDAMDPRLRM
ncbi:MAG: ABC transporter permease [Patescibacteria group bacterium]|nr:ABC transporter permease [Patescibacteria group bacterium]